MMEVGACREESLEPEIASSLAGLRSRVLVVDDDEAVRSAFALALSDLGCELVLAADGFEALNFVAHNPVDLVFLDLRMPGVDGVRTLRLLRETRPDAKICVLTAFVEEHMGALIDLASERMDFELFRKPLDIDEIRALTTTLLQPTGSGSVAGRPSSLHPVLGRRLAERRSRSSRH